LSSPYTASHFHVGAPGVGGPVVHPFTIVGNTIAATWSNPPDSIITDLFQGQVYVNVHSTKHPGGEIRGQLSMVSGLGFITTMDQAQETPPTGSSAMGTAWAVLDSNGARIRYRVTVAGLDTILTAGHFHAGAPGIAGPVVHPISFIDSTSLGEWSGVPDTDAINLMKGNLYFNVHTAVNPGGAIRGQLVKVGPSVFTASLDGTQETPPDTSHATGTAWAVMSPDLQTFTYGLTYADLSAPYTASHFHAGAAGIGGPVILPITAYHGNTANDTASTPPDSIIGDFVSGKMYVNVHSTRFPGGEIRGQLWPTQGLGFFTTMTAAQETPPTGTAARGTAWAVLDTSGSNVSYSVTVAGLDTILTAGHFHDGAPGIAGPVVHPIAFTDSSANGTWTAVPSAELLSLVKGNLYFNVHTPVNPGGAIRGQLGAVPGALTAVQGQRSVLPSGFSLAQNYPNPFNPSTKIAFSVSSQGFVTLKVYDILGRVVATLVNGEMQPGAYTTTFQAGNLASGVYFYRMQVRDAAAARNSQTFKMLLVR